MKKVLFFILAIICLWTCEKTPEEIAVTSVSLSQATAEMIEGETAQLIATVLPSNATDKSVIWASSKQSVATVSNTGLVTAVAEGTSTITASAGGKSATCTVTVSKMFIEVSSVKLNKESLELVEGDSETLIATVLPENATDKTVTWESSDPSVASVDQNGMVIAVAEGQAGITAMIGDKSSFCKVFVSKKVIAVESIELDKTELTLFEGEAETIVATVKPDNATNKTIIWSSSDSAIAKVEDGMVTAFKEGNVTVTAKAEDKTAECIITVKKKAPLGSVDLGIVMTREDGTTYNLYWAECNLGASKPEEYGYYYAWAETEPKTIFSWENYKWYNGSQYGGGSKLINYNSSVIQLEDDAANVALGGDWRIPTRAEIFALEENCQWEWTELNDIFGYLVVSKVNGNSIFLPAAGFLDAGWHGLGPETDSATEVGVTGHYWASTFFSISIINMADLMIIYSGYIGAGINNPCSGCTIRPVTE